MFEELLIEAVKNHPCIYNKALQIYRNKLLKEKAWVEVAAAVGMKEEMCQTRWRSLRDRFLKELNKKQKSGSEAPEDSPWKYFQLLLFLKEHVAPRRTFSNNWNSEEELCQSEVTDEASQNSIFEEFVADSEPSFDAPSTSTNLRPKRAKVQEAGDRFDALVGAVQDMLKAKAEKSQKSRNAVFLAVLDEYLLKLTEGRQDELKNQILSLVLSDFV